MSTIPASFYIIGLINLDNSLGLIGVIKNDGKSVDLVYHIMGRAARWKFIDKAAF